MDGGAWKAEVHGVTEGRTQLSDFTFSFQFHALEKEMATHFSILFFFSSSVKKKNLFFFKFYFIFKLYIIVLVLPNIKMNPPQVYMCSPS